MTPSTRAECGLTLIELLAGVGLAAVLALAGGVQLRVGLDEYRARGAARYMAGRFNHARTEAVARSASTAVRFSPVGSSYAFATFADGDRDGVLATDIQMGTDLQIGPIDALSLQFAGVDFGVMADVPSADGTPLGTAEPVRFGASRMVVFTANGTATPGSLYIRGDRGAQYVVRVYGDTGKAQALRFDARRRLWVALW